MLIAAVLILIPAAAIGGLFLMPEQDSLLMDRPLHFYIVSGACLLSAAICGALVMSARSIRETRILFLALCFLSLALIFSIHGLMTPGHIHDSPSAALTRSPYLATLAAAIFAALSVVSIPRFMERATLRLPEATFGLIGGLLLLYMGLSIGFPNMLEGFPTTDRWFGNLLSAVTIALLAFAAWRYFESYLFARLPGQLAVVVGLVLLAEAQVSLNWGQVWHLSWWIYHALFFIAFGVVLAGWSMEVIRSRSVKAIADGLVMRDSLTQLNRGRPNAVVSLADEIESRDIDTFRHVDRVAAYAHAIGEKMGLGPARLRELVLAAQLHDIGKIGLPQHILTKPDKLTDEEWWIMKQHPGKGWEIVSRAKRLRSVADIIRHHHEQFDGTGYPDGLAGEQIPLEARVISAADTFDAVTSSRPYRAAMSVEEATAELRRVSGSQLDPRCVQALLEVIENGGVKPAPEQLPVPEPTVTA